MDFLDPKKVRRSRTMLLLGYCLVALAIGIATLVLLYQAYGFGIDKKGQVTQNGLVFVSSQPSGAAIYLNNQLYKAATNTRVVVPAGTYTLKITDTGYRNWQRQVVVAGGDVQHFDYPFLFPAQLHTTEVNQVAAEPGMVTQSPDRRWIVASEADKPGSFLVYDIKNATKPVQTEIRLPDGAYTAGDGQQAWKLVEWANDNRHILLQHTYSVGQDTSDEYVLVDRDTPADSTNVTTALKLNNDESVTLFNKKTDQYYVYNSSSHSLRQVSAADGTTISQLDHILAYKSYGSDQLVYVTDHPPTGKTNDATTVSMVLQDGQKTLTLRTLPANASAYLLDIARYSGDWYVAVGASNDTGVYIYKNPQSETLSAANILAPWRRLAVNHPSYIAFSANTQFLLAESGQEFAVYDAENVVQYHYTAKPLIDQPQTHATWMDGDRLMYSSGGKLVIFDYDYRNIQSLETADANFLPAFAPDYSAVFTVRPAAGANKAAMTNTPLTIK